MDPLKMYFLLDMLIFQPAMLVYQGVMTVFGQDPSITQFATNKLNQPIKNHRVPTIGSWSVPKKYISHKIHVWYIYLHLVDFYGKCR